MMRPQLHLEPIQNKNYFSVLAEYVEVHTYNEPVELCYLNIFGSNADENSQSVDLWLVEEDIRALRDALNQVLGE